VSERSSSDPPRLDALKPYCKSVAFAAGDVLRLKGQHYKDLYLIADGRVRVRLKDQKEANGAIELGAGATIGEIGFLQGSRATAHVTAIQPSRALIIDDGTIGRIEAEDPKLAIRLSRFLAGMSEQRIRENNAVLDATQHFGENTDIEVLLCRNEAMLARAQRLRYEVYCRELGRDSPYADHDKRTIKDSLDEFGHTFIVDVDGETIGTLRGNLACEGDLGILEELYGMLASAHHPARTSICTKFIIKKSHRGGAVTMTLLAALAQYAIRNDIRECFIDCIPALLHYYRSMGFKHAGEKFLHHENGPSFPMRIDVVKHAGRLRGELGPMKLLQTYVRAQMYRWFDGRRRTGVGS